jgi:hypothetical protein
MVNAGTVRLLLLAIVLVVIASDQRSLSAAMQALFVASQVGRGLAQTHKLKVLWGLSHKC